MAISINRLVGICMPTYYDRGKAFLGPLVSSSLVLKVINVENTGITVDFKRYTLYKALFEKFRPFNF